ncbi:TPA: hypothetical protein KDX64_000621 [Vibrio vulnificus]|uniref:imm11 family protein n=1 Tax=Vibrio vulnificus TaxID=672 RepID=UPI001B83DB13|nr:DUF1629 domain-containing protein [Vibrio vulnificus]ELK8587305.1 hypothetical protein [Vibrio vulnificus]MCA3962706.1 hypothetical protein [Vibrio vulnificus]MCA4018891.1 hypothetical protein [Vibrio vulnificus]MDS1802426.1 hypothetical protein [Vibrio vulnificus]HBC3367275.1 hypothetical protein [Vibrio vulnificus]
MKYDHEYYIMSPDYDVEGYSVIPSDSTSLRRFHYRELVYGEPALRFSTKNGQTLDEDVEMLFCTPSFIISEDLKEVFDDGVYGGKLYPAIINNTKHSYFLINIYEALDCWDRNRSVYEHDDPDDEPHVIKYSLNHVILDEIPESDRLVFKMGGDDLAPIVVHKTIKRKLERKIPYLKFYSIESYQLGEEY